MTLTHPKLGMYFSSCATACIKYIFIRLSNDAKHESSLLYTRRRDIHSVGIVFLQMLLGLDVMQKFDDVHEALRSCTSTNPLLYFMVLIPMRS